MGIHARKSPSGAERYHACPGSLALEETLPPEQRSEGGPAARLGTAAHALLERCLTEQVKPALFAGHTMALTEDPETKKDGVHFLSKAHTRGKPFPGEIGRFPVDADMVEGVSLAYDYVADRCNELCVPMDRLALEMKTNPLPDRDDTRGTADVTIDAWPMILEVVDYKNGRLTVEHDDNPQLLSYLLGRAHDTNWDHAEYAITVVQPNARHDEGRVRTFHVTAEALREFEMLHRVACEQVDTAADDPRLTDDRDAWAEDWLTAGEHCTFCDAVPVCPARRALVEKEAQIVFADDPQEIPVPTLPEDIVRVLAHKPFIMDYLRAVEQYAFRAMTSGEAKLPGAKLVRKRSKRMWRKDMSPDEIAAAMVEKGYLNSNEQARLFKEPEMITGPQAEKLLEGKKLRDQFSNEFLIKPPGALDVVPSDDPRPEVIIDAGEVFEGVED